MPRLWPRVPALLSRYLSALVFCIGTQSAYAQTQLGGFPYENFISIKFVKEVALGQDAFAKIFTLYDYQYHRQACKSEACDANRYMVIFYKSDEYPESHKYISGPSKVWSRISVTRAAGRNGIFLISACKTPPDVKKCVGVTRPVPLEGF